LLESKVSVKGELKGASYDIPADDWMGFDDQNPAQCSLILKPSSKINDDSGQISENSVPDSKTSWFMGDQFI
jgi:hypothetical protein